MKNIDITARLLPLLLLILASSCVSKEYPVTGAVKETRYRTEYITEAYTENETIVDTITDSYELPLYYSWYSQNIAFNSQANFWYLAYDVPQWPTYDNLRLTISIWKQFQYESASIRILDMTRSGHLSTPAPAIYGDTETGQVKWNWITPGATGTVSTSSSSSSGASENPSEESAVSTTGGVATTWLDTANVQINQARFLGGRTNLWSRTEDPQVFELDAGKAQKIGVIVSGPENRWNARVTLKGAFTRDIVSYKTVSGERRVEKQSPYEVQKQQTTYQVRQVPFWEIFSQ